MVASASILLERRRASEFSETACTNLRKGVSHGSTNTMRPSFRSTRSISENVFSRSSGSAGRWCKPPWTIRTSLLRSANGSCRQSPTKHFAEPRYCAINRGDKSTPSMCVKPSRSSAFNPLPRPQKSSTSSPSRGHLFAPNFCRRPTNFSISCSGVSNRRYAASHGSGKGAVRAFLFCWSVLFPIVGKCNFKERRNHAQAVSHSSKLFSSCFVERRWNTLRVSGIVSLPRETSPFSLAYPRAAVRGGEKWDDAGYDEFAYE